MSGDLTEHFSLYEFSVTTTGIDNTVPPTAIPWIRRLCWEILEPIRAEVGPIRITSGYRSAAVNTVIGGSRTSAHCYGRAADIKAIRGASAAEILGIAKACGLPVDQAIGYDPERGGHVHLGIASKPRNQYLWAPKTGGYLPWP